MRSAFFLMRTYVKRLKEFSFENYSGRIGLDVFTELYDPVAGTILWLSFDDTETLFGKYNGRCYALGALPILLHEGNYTPSDFKPSASHTFELDKNDYPGKISLRRLIDMYEAAGKFRDIGVTSNTTARTLVNEVQRAIAADTAVLLNIFHTNGGHAVVAYDIKPYVDDPNQYFISIYDSNPGLYNKEDNYLVANTLKDTWHYDAYSGVPGYGVWDSANSELEIDSASYLYYFVESASPAS
ncbi:MAG: hypothetical protein LBB94_00945, partial [Clostridiales bacterium]|nr:hypothetical protein [Clostridiales bacterium]